MMKFVSGDMFETPADIRVNTVNCVGVMGAGVALAFKTKYPAMFRAYKAACDAQEVQPGKLNIWRTLDGEWVINFPTKRHWRENSRYEDIELGLVALRDYLAGQGRVRVTLPALGCGHGGLDWERVSAMIREQLADLDAEIFVFQPSDSRREDDDDTAIARLGGRRFEGEHPGLRERQVVLSVIGNHELLRAAWVAILPSPSPGEREVRVAEECVAHLSRSKAILSIINGTKLATRLLEEAIGSGGSVVLWVPEGLTRFHVSQRLKGYLEMGSLVVVSIAKHSERWRPELVGLTRTVECALARTLLITDPEPTWLSEVKTAQRSLFYIKYNESKSAALDLLSSLGASAVGRSATSRHPNMTAVLRELEDDSTGR
jgi:O-acetyl-ADP-ribose deacetylase (regulator of RNase III)